MNRKPPFPSKITCLVLDNYIFATNLLSISPSPSNLFCRSTGGGSDKKPVYNSITDKLHCIMFPGIKNNMEWR